MGLPMGLLVLAPFAGGRSSGVLPFEYIEDAMPFLSSTSTLALSPILILRFLFASFAFHSFKASYAVILFSHSFSFLILV